jgi:acyl-CoA thioesterase I
MKTSLIILAVLILYFGVELAIFYYRETHLPVLPKIDQAQRTLGSGPALKYIAAGDSTGVGYGASDETKTYTYQVAQFLAKNHTVEYRNISVVGAKTEDVLQNQISQIIAYQPDIITISIGPNDATHLVSENKIISNYKNIIAQLEQGTKAKIYITDIANFKDASVLPWFYYYLLEYRSSYINPKILALEDTRTKIVDIHNFGWANYNRPKTYAADNFHPNDLGYQNWTNAFLNKISSN